MQFVASREATLTGDWGRTMEAAEGDRTAGLLSRRRTLSWMGTSLGGDERERGFDQERETLCLVSESELSRDFELGRAAEKVCR
jgi:hypothetical protein